MHKNHHAALAIAVASMIASPASFAASKAVIDARVDRTLHTFDQLNPEHVDLAGKAAGVLIFPRITKAGAGIGGEYGDGVLQVKGKTVGYYSVTSASIGLTLGVARHSDVILFMTQDALDSFTNSHGWAVGADTGAAFDQQGAGHDYTVQTLKKPVLTFVFGEKGLIADASLEGSKVNRIDR
jgi:lipid-binding SYLF domain-containing protein